MHVMPSPTHVGMDRRYRAAVLDTQAKPHARGDGPNLSRISFDTATQAPRTWGWTAGHEYIGSGTYPSPTHVGMDRSPRVRRPAVHPKPHARGDGPEYYSEP